jgi:hypothetical protein
LSQILQDLIDGVHPDHAEARIFHVHDHVNGGSDDRREAQHVYPTAFALPQSWDKKLCMRIPDLSAMGQRQLKIGVYVEGSA